MDKDLEEHFKTNLIPSEDDTHLKRFKRLKYHDHLIPFPFAISVVGTCGSGKSSTIWSMLSKLYKGAFDIIYLYNGTKDSNDAWKSLANEDTKVIVQNEFNMDEFKEAIDTLEKENLKRKNRKKLPINALVMFDDMAGEDIVRASKRDFLLKTLLNRRHISVSFIFSSQRYRLLPQDWRAVNINAVIVCGISPDELNRVAEEHQTIGVPPDVIKEMYKETKEMGAYVPFIIDLTKPPSKRFRAGWLGYFDTKNNNISK